MTARRSKSSPRSAAGNGDDLSLAIDSISAEELRRLTKRALGQAAPGHPSRYGHQIMAGRLFAELKGRPEVFGGAGADSTDSRRVPRDSGEEIRGPNR